ncbi:MAG TPA: hypothetical protein VGK71_03395 [Nitrospirota bacterium]
MTEEQKQKIRDAVQDGKLPCPVAFKLAKELEISIKEIGQFCNDENLRIKNCQLGCFP